MVASARANRAVEDTAAVLISDEAHTPTAVGTVTVAIGGQSVGTLPVVKYGTGSRAVWRYQSEKEDAGE